MPLFPDNLCCLLLYEMFTLGVCVPEEFLKFSKSDVFFKYFQNRPDLDQFGPILARSGPDLTNCLFFNLKMISLVENRPAVLCVQGGGATRHS